MGQAFDGVVLAEFGDMNPSLFGRVVRRALSERKGFAVVIGRIKGISCGGPRLSRV